MLGLEFVRQFFADPTMHSGKWLEYYQNYSSIPHKSKNAQEFRTLDIWYHSVDVSRGFITQPELVQIMKWKLLRGKMRPLLGKIEALTELEVQQASHQAVNYLRAGINVNNVRLALDAIAKPLKGVGPATASAVLAKYSYAIPFMSDAGLLAVNGKLDYTSTSYMKYYEGISRKVEQLKNDGQSAHDWTARDVELVLHMIYSKYDLKVNV